MTYASEILGHYIIREVELLQMKFLKHVLFVHKNTSTDMVFGELGVYPVEVYIKCKTIGFWLQIISGKQSKLSYLMYKCLLELDMNGVYTSPWIKYVKGIINDCRMSSVWLTQNVNNTNWFKKKIESILKDQWITWWNSNLRNKSICSTYRMYREVYGMEKYLVKLQE